MIIDRKTQDSSGAKSAYAFRKAILRICMDADVSELLDLADDLHDLIRARRALAHTEAGSRLATALQMTPTVVFLD